MAADIVFVHIDTIFSVIYLSMISKVLLSLILCLWLCQCQIPLGVPTAAEASFDGTGSSVSPPAISSSGLPTPIAALIDEKASLV